MVKVHEMHAAIHRGHGGGPRSRALAPAKIQVTLTPLPPHPNAAPFSYCVLLAAGIGQTHDTVPANQQRSQPIFHRPGM